MALMNDFVNAELFGEPDRLDDMYRQHDQLRLELKHLVDRLIEKNVLTRAEAQSVAPRLMSTSEPEPPAESE